jgi:hypothetical protein
MASFPFDTLKAETLRAIIRDLAADTDLNAAAYPRKREAMLEFVRVVNTSGREQLSIFSWREY